MDAPTTAAVAFGTAAVVSVAATPAAIWVAQRTNFYDRPGGYHKHATPTPYLGGAAVLLAILTAAAAIGVSGKLLLILGCAIGLWLLGTLDDRIAVPPAWRLLAETLIAIGLYVDGLGWHTSLPGAANVALTILWVSGVVNAFNLMDNLDGACSSVATAAAAGVGVLATLKGEPIIAGAAFALCGACVGFLPWNLAGPAKIFLGDGGSMPVGFLVAALAMATARHAPAGNLGVLVAAMCAGLPLLDTTLVTYSRSRRGVPIVTGGRDHLSHRLLLMLRSPRWVAAALMLMQGCLCVLAIVGHELGTAGVLALSFATFVAGTASILVLDTDRWRPAGIAMGVEQPRGHAIVEAGPAGLVGPVAAD